jgi:hypothetical protein
LGHFHGNASGTFGRIGSLGAYFRGSDDEPETPSPDETIDPDDHAVGTDGDDTVVLTGGADIFFMAALEMTALMDLRVLTRSRAAQGTTR